MDEEPHKIDIASPPDREHLVAEILVGGEQWAEVNIESGRLDVELYPRGTESRGRSRWMRRWLLSRPRSGDCSALAGSRSLLGHLRLMVPLALAAQARQNKGLTRRRIERIPPPRYRSP